MQFSINEWKRVYNKVHALGKQLKEARVDYDGNPAINPLPFHTQREIENDIQNLTNKSNRYLDACNIRYPIELWAYNRQDKTTWASHSSFKYAHLMEF